MKKCKVGFFCLLFGLGLTIFNSCSSPINSIIDKPFTRHSEFSDIDTIILRSDSTFIRINSSYYSAGDWIYSSRCRCIIIISDLTIVDSSKIQMDSVYLKDNLNYSLINYIRNFQEINSDSIFIKKRLGKNVYLLYRNGKYLND